MMHLLHITKQRVVLVTSILLTALTWSCSTMTKAEREAQKAERANYVAKVLDNRRYQIDVNVMYPRRGGSMVVTSNWSLEVKGDTLVSYLPYFGVSHEATIGTTQGLNFTAPILSYKDSGIIKGKRTIHLKANSEEDHLEFQIEVMDDGSSYIDVISRKRDGIGFSGNISDEE